MTNLWKGALYEVKKRSPERSASPGQGREGEGRWSGPEGRGSRPEVGGGGGQGRKCGPGEVVRARSAGGGPIESRLSKRVIMRGGGSGVPIAPDGVGGEVGCGHWSCPPDKPRTGVSGRAWGPALGVRGTERLLLRVLS